MLCDFGHRGRTRGDRGEVIRIENWERQVRTRVVQASIAHPDLLDARFAFTDGCEKDVDQILKKKGYCCEPFISLDRHCEYMALLDVDGNTWSSR